MSVEVKSFVAVIVACFVGITTYRRLRNRKSKKQKFIENADKSGHFVTGQYVDLNVLPGIYGSKNPQMQDDSLRVKYKYIVNGVAYYKSITFQSRGRIGTDFPSSVTVYYNPANPKKAVCPEEAHPRQQIRVGCLSTILVTILTSVAIRVILEFLF